MKLKKDKLYFLHTKEEGKEAMFYAIARFLGYLENNSLVSVVANCRVHAIENNLMESTDSYNRYEHFGFEYVQLSEITVENFHTLFPDEELPEGVATDSQLAGYYWKQLAETTCY